MATANAGYNPDTHEVTLTVPLPDILRGAPIHMTTILGLIRASQVSAYMALAEAEASEEVFLDVPSDIQEARLNDLALLHRMVDELQHLTGDNLNDMREAGVPFGTMSGSPLAEA